MAWADAMRPNLDLAAAPGLARFVEAQSAVYDEVQSELAAGCKASHWMWFIFPQLKVLGRSATAKFYGLDDLAEAVAYASHPVLGARLRQCTRLVLAIEGRSAHSIFGSPDDLKLRSCMTLFDAAVPADHAFRSVLARFYDGAPDAATLALLR
ncbi:MAG: DUF1810 domain-containing protein [Caldimonas sp.]